MAAKQYLAANERILDQIKRRSEAGVGRVADLEQAQGRVALAQSTVISAQRDLDDASSTYQRVVGVAPVPPMTRPELTAASLPADLVAAEAMALNAHPALKSSEAEVAAAQAQSKVVNGAFYPQVDLVAMQRWGRDMDGLEGVNQSNSVMLEGRYNVFNGGRDSARTREYEYRHTQAEGVRERTRRQVLENVRLAWSASEASKEQLNYLKVHEQASRNARDAYIKQFGLGRRSLLDVLDTEKELYEASRAHVTGVYDNIYAQYRVLAGTGTLLSVIDAKDTGDAENSVTHPPKN